AATVTEQGLVEPRAAPSPLRSPLYFAATRRSTARCPRRADAANLRAIPAKAISEQPSCARLGRPGGLAYSEFSRIASDLRRRDSDHALEGPVEVAWIEKARTGSDLR